MKQEKNMKHFFMSKKLGNNFSGKMILIIGLLAVFSLLVACNIEQPVEEDETVSTTDEVETVPPVESELEETEPVTEDLPVETETPVDEVEVDLSEEELNQLEEDLNDMEFDDLGGLTE
jgi:hypothetical protein